MSRNAEEATIAFGSLYILCLGLSLQHYHRYHRYYRSITARKLTSLAGQENYIFEIYLGLGIHIRLYFSGMQYRLIFIQFLEHILSDFVLCNIVK